MYRLFQDHYVRKSVYLPQVWNLETLNQSPSVVRRVPVPGCVEMLPGLGRYKGEVKLWTEAEFGGNLRLVFKGVGHTAEVSLDDTYLGSHYGAYGEFSFLLRNVNYDSHVISVTADNSFGPESALHVDNDYYSYGGITRPVLLEQIGDVYIKWAHVTSVREEGEWWADIQVCLENMTDRVQKVSLGLEIKDTDGQLGEKVAGSEPEEIFVPAGDTAIFQDRIPCPGVKAYEAGRPELYYLHTVLYGDREEKEEGSRTGQWPGQYRRAQARELQPMDDLIERFGFREIRVEGDRILWNDKPLRIKGFNRHEEYGNFGSAVPVSAMQHDLELMKDMGANCVRTCHYPNDERFLDLCDEQGILVWEEAHARGLSEEQMRNLHFMEQSQLTMEEMITGHYNHPCIFVWGLLNECASNTEYGRDCYEKLIAPIRMSDDSRPVTFASCHWNDLCLDLVDIVSFNCYPKWYIDQPVDQYLEELMQWIRTAGGAGKPFLISEIGAGAIYGYRSTYGDKWSEEYQAQALEEQIRAGLSFAPASGVILWLFADVRVDDGWFSRRPKSHNNKGLVDVYRRPKLAYEKVKELFGEL